MYNQLEMLLKKNSTEYFDSLKMLLYKSWTKIYFVTVDCDASTRISVDAPIPMSSETLSCVYCTVTEH